MRGIRTQYNSFSLARKRKKRMFNPSKIYHLLALTVFSSNFNKTSNARYYRYIERKDIRKIRIIHLTNINDTFTCI